MIIENHNTEINDINDIIDDKLSGLNTPIFNDKISSR